MEKKREEIRRTSQKKKCAVHVKRMIKSTEVGDRY